MHRHYRLIRTTGTLDDLARLVEAASAQGWNASGTPFRDHDAREWCLAMEKPREPEELKLREPKKK